MVALLKSSLDPSRSENYRPISLLPFLSKVAEKYVNQQRSGFVEQRNLLQRIQLGFHPQYGTESALLLASESMCQTMGRETAALLLLDPSAAFKTMSHSQLIGEAVELRGQPLGP